MKICFYSLIAKLQKQRERAIARSIPLSEAEKAVQQSILAIVAETESITVFFNQISR